MIFSDEKNSFVSRTIPYEAPFASRLSPERIVSLLTREEEDRRRFLGVLFFRALSLRKASLLRRSIDRSLSI